MIQFYAPDILTDSWLPADEAGHCVRVLRKKPGDEIVVTDGKDRRYFCRIAEADSRNVRVEIIRTEEILPHWKHKIKLAIAPTKNADRMEWLIEKVVEMGIDEIYLLKCSNSERKVLKLERLHRIMVSAMKQSLKTRLPMMFEMQPIEDFLKEESAGEKYIAYCSEECGQRLSLAQIYDGHKDVTLLIGPEGDFTNEEVQAAINAGYKTVTLGNSRLRTETAAMFGVAAIHTINQRMTANE